MMTTPTDHVQTSPPPPGDVWTPGTKAVIIFDAVLVLLGAGYTLLALRMDLGTLAKPGPGLIPVFIGVLVVIMFAADLARQLLRHPKEVGSGRPPYRNYVILLSIPVYGVLAGTLGHIVASTVVVGWLLATLGKRRWWVVALTAVLSGVLTYGLFALLGVALPSGILGIEW